MARAIDADEFAKRLMELWDKAEAERRNDIVSVLANYITPCLVGTPTIEPKQEWISVKDRLPERLKEVLICFDDYGRKSVSTATYRDYFYGKEWLSNMVSLSVDCVTHWMPLPEPPEKNNEEEQA